jgi:Protein of unknown function (DUF2459)
MGMAVLTSACSIRVPVTAEVQRVEKGAVRSAKSQVPQAPDVLVWLLADELHTGVVFSYDWLIESGFQPPKGFPKSKYVTLSWGNREAYVQEAWLTPWQAIRALCWPSPSVMELIPFDYEVVDVCPYQRVWRKLVSRDHGPAVAAFLNGCARRDSGGLPRSVGKSSWGNGVLLDSPHSYYLPRICNVWTLQAMEACGCRIHPWGGLTASGVIRQAEKPENGFEKIWNAYPIEKTRGEPAR